MAHRFSDRDRLFLSFYHGRDYFRYKDSDKGTATISSGDGSSYKEYSEDDVKANLKWGNMLAVMRWNHVFSNKLFANTSVSWNKYDMNIKSDIREMVKSEKEFYDNTYKYGYNSGIMDFGGRIDFDYTPAPQHLIRFGTVFIRHAYRPSVQRVREINEDGVKKTLTDEKTDISPTVYGSELSLYMEDDMTLGVHFSFNPGARLSLFFVDGKAYFSPEPRVALKYSFGEGWALKTAYSRMSQYVHLLTSGDISLPTDLWVPITKNIRPVTSDIVSLGAYFSGLKGWEFSLEGYWKRLNNVLEYKAGKMAFTSAANWEENVEMGEGRAYGGGFMAGPEAQPDDGWLDVFIVRKVSRRVIAKLLMLYKNGQHFQNGQLPEAAKPYFIYRRAKSVSLRAADGRGPIIATVDGECAPCKQVSVQVQPLAGRVLLPLPAYQRFTA